jgi:imidazolonepropionase
MIEADLMITNTSQIVTCRGPAPRLKDALKDPEIVARGAMACRAGKIAWIGKDTDLRHQVKPDPVCRRIDAAGGVVLPGLVDAHTHLVFAGTREAEFEARLRGSSYEEIAAAGGGIMSSVRATREASLETLVQLGKARLDRMLSLGTTTVEAKSGYGLSVEAELKQLRAIRILQAEHPVDIIPTFLGAHSVPVEYRPRREAYIRLVKEEMIPGVAEEALAEYCDIFTEKDIFSIEESEDILLTAKAAGMKLKVHADELYPLGGAEMAARLGARSAEHLVYISDEGIRMMAEAQVAAVLLPGTSFFLMSHHPTPARKMIASGVPVVIATDFNPGSNMTESMPMTITQACLMMQMDIGEALNSATINAAFAIDRGETVGSLEVGKKADFIIGGFSDYRYLAYHYGVNNIHTVVKDGKVCFEKGVKQY